MVASKGFLKAFIKPFEAPQRSLKTKIYVNFFSSSEMKVGRVKTLYKNVDMRYNMFSQAGICVGFVYLSADQR